MFCSFCCLHALYLHNYHSSVVQWSVNCSLYSERFFHVSSPELAQYSWIPLSFFHHGTFLFILQLWQIILKDIIVRNEVIFFCELFQVFLKYFKAFLYFKFYSYGLAFIIWLGISLYFNILLLFCILSVLTILWPYGVLFCSCLLGILNTPWT